MSPASSRQIREQGIRAVFIENVADSRLLERIADETGANIGGTLYPGALSGPDGPAPTYLDMMRHNAMTLAQALASKARRTAFECPAHRSNIFKPPVRLQGPRFNRGSIVKPIDRRVSKPAEGQDLSAAHREMRSRTAAMARSLILWSADAADARGVRSRG